MKKIIQFMTLAVYSTCVLAEPLPYEIQEDRFSFAQLYIGGDYSHYSITSPRLMGEQHTSSVSVPSITIGALHYWGKADFYVSFPLQQNGGGEAIEYSFKPGVETGFKYYPITITDKSFRPFVGAGFAFPSYQQTTDNNRGALQSKFVLAANAGVSYTLSPFIFDIGVKYTPNSHIDYYLAPDTQKRVEYSEYALFIGAKFFTDTTLAQRQQSGSSADLAKGLYPYIGIGPSSSWSTNDSSFVDKAHPHLGIKNDATVFPELSAGVHWKNTNRKGHRTIFNISYRPQQLEIEGFGITNKYVNNSLAVEVLQSFWDYHGFVPFAGLSYATNKLEFTSDASGKNVETTEKSNEFGAVFGWDILPSHQTPWFLRTTLRYYPEIALETPRGEIQFPNFEFNFIQFIYQF